MPHATGRHRSPLSATGRPGVSQSPEDRARAEDLVQRCDDAPRALVFELLAEVTVQGGDRLDLIAARTLGSADAWWRIADANETLDPAALTSPPPPAAGGAAAPLPAPRLRIPVPRA